PVSTTPPATPRSDLGLYVTRELFESVALEHRRAYMEAVEEFSRRKYQLGVEVARQLPRLFASGDEGAVERYLDAVRRVADVDWRAGVEAARYVHYLQASYDPILPEGYVAVVTEAVTASAEEREEEA